MTYTHTPYAYADMTSKNFTTARSNHLKFEIGKLSNTMGLKKKKHRNSGINKMNFTKG